MYILYCSAEELHRVTHVRLDRERIGSLDNLLLFSANVTHLYVQHVCSIYGLILNSRVLINVLQTILLPQELNCNLDKKDSDKFVATPHVCFMLFKVIQGHDGHLNC